MSKQESYVTAGMEQEVSALRHHVQVWLASSVKSQKEFFVYTKQAVWLSATHGNVLALQDIQQYLDGMSDLTGGIVNYAKTFKRLVKQIAGGVENIDGVDYFNAKQSLIEYKNGKYALTGTAQWADILGALSKAPKTTMKILAYMKMPSKPSKVQDKYIRIPENEYISIMATLHEGIEKDNKDRIMQAAAALAQYYND